MYCSVSSFGRHDHTELFAYSTFEYNSGQTHKNVKNQTTTELAYKTNMVQINWLSTCASAPLCII